MATHTAPTVQVGLHAWWIRTFILCGIIITVPTGGRAILGNVTGATTVKSRTLSFNDISRCISANSSLNITVENEVRISYSTESVFAASEPHVSKSARRRDQAGSQHTADNGGDSSDSDRQPGDLYSQKGGNSADHAAAVTGHCSIRMEASPDKVLSVLFLNQTCSLDNDVRVEDIHDGTDVTLNGCSLWKSPGYDVTTSDASAAVVIHLRDVTEFYKLEVQVMALGSRSAGEGKKLGLLTRYVSPVLGYVQTPCWHGYDKLVYGRMHDTATIVVPVDHVTMISVVYLYTHHYSHGYGGSFHLYLHKRTRTRASPQLVWSMRNGGSPPDVELLSDVTEFSVNVSIRIGRFFSGVRVLFSFHQPSLVPVRNSEDLWDCSVPFWADFHQHLVCNNKTECAGREDEMWCTNINCPQGGFQLDRTCYFFHLLPRQWALDTWSKAKTACRQRRAKLASFPTMRSWFHLSLLLTTKLGGSIIMYIGLRSADASFPFMYRYAMRWDDGPIAYYYHHYLWKSPPSCARIEYWRMFFLWYCNETPLNPDTTYALCQVTSSPHDDAEKATEASSAAYGEDETKTVSPKNPISKTTTFHPDTGNDVSNHAPVPAISCPKRHWTHRFLACDALSACWLNANDASSGDDVTMSVSGVKPVCAGNQGNDLKALFACGSGARLIPYSLVCDHLQDCMDNSDEDFCVFPPCSAFLHYTCANGQCVPYLNRCDNVVQCQDESDEHNCMMETLRICRHHSTPPAPLLVDFDGRGSLRYDQLHVTAGSLRQADRGSLCPDTHVLCPGDGYCLPLYVRCNGVYDCPGLEDEMGCDSHACPASYRCRGLQDTCLHPDHVCDGWPQCPQHDDERFCNLTCPEPCTCLGHAFTCLGDFQVKLFSHLRYLDAGGSGLKPGRLSDNPMLVYLNLARCELERLGNLSLPNLRSVDLCDNRLSVVTFAELSRLENLQNLSVARNPLSELFSMNVSAMPSLQSLLHLDLTEIPLKELDVHKLAPFPRLVSLNLTKTGVSRFVGNGFRSMMSLAVLDLRGCPVIEFPRDLFEGLSTLQRVFADNYKLCCPAMLPGGFNAEDCQAPFNEVSSCGALLRTDVYRICLALLASLALIGNLGCFCLRIFALTGRGKTGFNVFVTHLCVSDFMMGVYLLTIGVADRLYLGRYLWEERRWRQGAACQVAGVLALLSSEVSAFIICLITLDRFLVIRFPFSQLRFSPFSAQVASLLTWAAGVVLVTVPLLPVTSSWQFYGRTGICIPLPITQNDSAGHDYSFGVMILLNLVVFLLIAIGQIPVYLSMTSNAMSSSDTTRKSRDLIVARRLVTVVVSDFLCWFPLGLLGVLAKNGVPISGEVNVAMAIFVLPLNSALNPFLYTLNMILEKRRRAAEMKLLEMIVEGRVNEAENVKNRERVPGRYIQKKQNVGTD